MFLIVLDGVNSHSSSERPWSMGLWSSHEEMTSRLSRQVGPLIPDATRVLRMGFDFHPHPPLAPVSKIFRVRSLLERPRLAAVLRPPSLFLPSELSSLKLPVPLCRVCRVCQVFDRPCIASCQISQVTQGELHRHIGSGRKGRSIKVVV